MPAVVVVRTPRSRRTSTSRGPITYVQGKDNSGVAQPLVDKWNAEHPDEEVTLKEQTDEADQQHDDLVRNFDAQNEDYDVVSVDVIWTAEFAAKGYLQPLEDDLSINTEGLLEPTVEQGVYGGRQYTSPMASDGGMLYYRTDLIDKPPATWDEMMEMCSIADEEGIGLLRRAVPEVRGHDRQRLRGDQRRRWLHRGRGRQDVHRRQPGGGRGPGQPGRGVRERQHPEAGHRATPRRRAGSRSRRASCSSCATGPTSTAWPRRRRAPR